MRILIILRGPPGSGKSEIRKSLVKSFGMDNELLDLDQIIKGKFEENLNQVLNHNFVVGELHYGDGHTTDPELWLDRFKEKNYKILSIVLRVTLDTCVKRALCRQNNPLMPTNAINQFYLFYLKYQYIFAGKANVTEICLDNENRTSNEVAIEIKELFKKYNL